MPSQSDGRHADNPATSLFRPRANRRDRPIAWKNARWDAADTSGEPAPIPFFLGNRAGVGCRHTVPCSDTHGTAAGRRTARRRWRRQPPLPIALCGLVSLSLCRGFRAGELARHVGENVTHHGERRDVLAKILWIDFV